MQQWRIKEDIVLERESDPAKWKTVAPNDRSDYLINRAPVDELLTKFHLRLSGPGKPDFEWVGFHSLILTGRYTDAQIKALDRLTTTLYGASKKSTLLGWGLILVGLGTGALFVPEICKILWAKNRAVARISAVMDES